LEIVLQFYGLSFLFMGLLILVWPKQGSTYFFAKHLWLLGAFGLSHGLVEWVVLWDHLFGPAPEIALIKPTLLLVSYLFLFEFGRRLVLSSSDLGASSQLRQFMAVWIYVPLLGAIMFGVVASPHPALNFTILARYLFGLTGSILAGVGTLMYWRRHVAERLEAEAHSRMKIAFRALAAVFIAYAALGGLFVPRADWFPASVINSDAFLALFHFPVQVARALCAAIAAVATIYILQIFVMESRARLVAARSKNDLLLVTSGDGMHVLDLYGNCVEANDTFCEMLGYTREEVLCMTVGQWDAQIPFDEIKKNIPELIGQRAVIETLHRRRDGTIFPVEVSMVGIQVADQSLLYCAARDISDRRHAEEQLRLVAKAFDGAAEGVLITDENRTILTVNDAFTAVTGFTREAIVGRTIDVLKSDRHSPDFFRAMREEVENKGWWQGEIWSRRENGQYQLEWLSINAVRDKQGKITNYIGMFSDIALIKESRKRIDYLATHDALTDLPNRTMFNEHLKRALARSARHDTRQALLFIDLDNFKVTNDTLGHEEGDALLKQVATRLRDCVREMDTVARLGGDEFVVLLEIDDKAMAEAMARRIIEAFNPSFQLTGDDHFITASIGVSVFPEDATDATMLMRHADTAMYHAKEQGKNAFAFFSVRMAEQVSHRLFVETALRSALQNDELLLEYQPLIASSNNELLGVEALLRWRRDGQIVPPTEFIRIAEDCNFIFTIEEWVMGEVCRQIGEWDRVGFPPIFVSINISARHFSRPDLFDRITGVVGLAGVQPKRICLEVTEGALMDLEHSTRVLCRLRDAGFRVSVDDFGTGFSSLSYLKRFPIQQVKIDQSFIEGVADDAEDRSIVTAIIALAHELGLQSVAEGVESPVQQEVLIALGCDILQGYLYSKPLSGGSLLEWVRARYGEPVARRARR